MIGCPTRTRQLTADFLFEEPPLQPSPQGRLLILGDGRSLWEDVEKYGEPEDVMAVNLSGCFYREPLTHWVTCHGEMFDPWFVIKRCGNRPPTHTKLGRPADYQWPIIYGGSSGMLTILIALAMGYEDITLAGMPFDDHGHFYDPPYHGRGNTNFKAIWDTARDNWFQGKVKSLSGLTKDWLS